MKSLVAMAQLQSQGICEKCGKDVPPHLAKCKACTANQTRVWSGNDDGIDVRM